MKKILLVLTLVIMIVATGCNKNKKSKSLNYNDSNPIVMALSGTTHQFDRKIQVSSDYDITYTAVNDPNYPVITVTSDGYIHGKNVGTAKVDISNGYESMTVDVEVDLFIEPTFDFGCSVDKIYSLYGAPYQWGTNSEGILVYQYTSYYGYSYACGEMDFFFNEEGYYESDVYIRPTVEYQLNNYISDNFNHINDYNDTIVSPYTSQDTIITVSLYRSKYDSHVICGKRPALNQWREILLYYFKVEDNDLAKSLYIRPRSSKLRY